MTLVVAGGTVVTSIDPVRVAVADVVVDGGRVRRVRTPAGPADGEAAEAAEAGASRLDATGCLVLPGNVCAHTHLYSALARGMPYDLEPPRSFLEILRRVWWRLDRALDEESIRASALVGGMEALLSGTTTLVDHHASPGAIDGSLDLVAEALGSLGIRGVLAYETSDRDGPERAAAGLRENARFADRVIARAYPLARSMIGAHASFTLSPDTLDGCVDAARATMTGIHVHVAEGLVDGADSRARYGMSVVERLEKAGAIDARAILAHAVDVDPDDAAIIRDGGSTVVHNARSNMNNAVGRAPLGLLGERVALGTDGIGADMFEESRVAWLRAAEDRIAGGPGWALARLAESARVAGRAFAEPALGRLDEGAPADLIVLDAAPPTPLDAGTLAGHWGFGLASRHVRDVVVAGEVVVRDRRLARADQAQIAAEARVAAARLWARLEAIGEHPFEPLAVHAR